VTPLNKQARARLNRVRETDPVFSELYKVDTPYEPTPVEYLSQFSVAEPDYAAVREVAERIKAGTAPTVRVNVGKNGRVEVTNPQVLAAYMELGVEYAPTIAEVSKDGGRVNASNEVSLRENAREGQTRPSRVFRSLRPAKPINPRPQPQAQTAPTPEIKESTVRGEKAFRVKVSDAKDARPVTMIYRQAEGRRPAGWYIVNRNRPAKNKTGKPGGLDTTASRIATEAGPRDPAQAARDLVANAQLSEDSTAQRAARGETERYAGPREEAVGREVEDQVSLQPSEIYGEVERITGDWTNAPEVRVVRRLDETPANLKRANEKTPALYRDGVVYLVANNIPSMQDVAPLLYHEGLVHFGLDQQFGSRLDSVLRQIYNSNQKVRVAVNRLADLGSDPYASRDDRIPRLVEELFATQAESSETFIAMPSVMTKLRQLIRDFARRMKSQFFNSDLAYSDAEVARIIRLTAANVTRGKRKAVTPGAVRYAMFDQDAPRIDPGNAAELNDGAQKIKDSVRKVASRYTESMREKLGPGAQRTTLGWVTWNHISQQYGSLFKDPKNEYGNPLAALAAAHDLRAAVRAYWAEIAMEPYDEYSQLKADVQDGIGQLMPLSYLRIDPTKTWAQVEKYLTQLNKESGNKIQLDMAEMKRQWQRGREILNKIGPDGRRVYNAFVETNKAFSYAQMTTSLYNYLARNDAVLTAVLGKDTKHPMRQFMESRQSVKYAPRESRVYWAAEFEKLGNKIVEFQKENGVELMKFDTATGKKQALDFVRDLVNRINKDAKNVEAMRGGGAYFHLGRFGNYFANFRLKTRQTADGQTILDEDAIEQIRGRMRDAGFSHAFELYPGQNQDRVFVRFETESQQQNFSALLKQLSDEGLLATWNKESGKALGPAGLREVDGRLTPQAEMEVVSILETLPLDTVLDDDETIAAVRQQLLNAHMDRLPDTAAVKLFSKRDYVQGFTPDMVRAYAFRAQVGANSMATLSSSQPILKAFAEMSDAVRAAQADQSAKAPLMRSILNEATARERDRAGDFVPTWMDTARAINHAYFLGMSPAYFLTNLTQIGVMLWPELAKRQGVGFGRAFGSIAKGSGPALKVVRAMLSGPNAWEGTLTPNQLIDQGFGKWETRTDPKTGQQVKTPVLNSDGEFVMRMINTGAIDIGGAARQLGRVVGTEGNQTVSNALKYAGVLGLYSEIVTRMTAAMASRDLDLQKNPEMSMDEQVRNAARTVHESMFNYAESNVARQLGRNGFLGQPTKLVTAFMQYSVQVLEKLARELGAAFKGDVAAMKFLGGHFAAVGFLAGSMGLPFATVVFEAIEELHDIFDDDEEPFDAAIAYRNFLADIFGRNVGEVLARGVPRAFDVDLSIRTGEQNLMPFSELLADERTWEEAIKEMAFRGYGTPLSMVSDLFSGGAQMLKGNVLEGMKQSMPIALRGVVKSYELTDKGFVDAQGRVLPISPTGWNVVNQFLGGGSARLAEYREARFGETIRSQKVQRQVTTLQQQIAKAIESGDRDRARELLIDAPQWLRLRALAGLERSMQSRIKISGGLVPPGTRRTADIPLVSENQRFANYLTVPQ